ncbi:MAG: hypothetical protein UT39_C0029G0002 [Candidatus Woesebacteria bacterium GW2011_GWA1_39_21]|uniref:Uncharacterized protein n=1 Tax=Candidatus Woesebacteria bacterium GW2011_GWA1_39_21 TaxID=1618550 RepID=A0A0G0N2S5_9BACT|nr:MAG: hypothetical protein UT39_C0029G0002 [Candidatus Woesebacteria bacterium GW2011_GWA1_39_21]
MEQEPETQLITDEECVEAMRLGKSEIVQRWHIGQEKIADQDPTARGRIAMDIKLGRLQLAAGLVDSARETLLMASEYAYQLYDDESIKHIQEILDQIG